MSKKRKNFKKKATKQHGSDTMMIDNADGLHFMKGVIHQGRTTTTYSGPKKFDPEDARNAFNDGLYRGISVSPDEG